METQCVVCGSQNDLRSLRCFVCGAELPPVSPADQAHDAMLNMASLQGLTAAVKVPLSVGALPLEEMLSKRPDDSHIKEQSVSHEQLDVLLGPEDLSPLLQTTGESSKPKAEQQAHYLSDTPEDSPIYDSADEPIADIPDTWIGIPVPDLEEISKSDQAVGRSSNSNENIESVFSPISRLLEDHNRQDRVEAKSSLRSVNKPLKIPRENALTGAELKKLEAEVVPSRWERNSNDSSASLSSIAALSPREDEEERETALRVSIPELLAVQESEQGLVNDEFVPISTLPHAKGVLPTHSVAEDPLTIVPIDIEEASQGFTDLGMRGIPQNKKHMTSLSWFLLALSSITVGIVIALYNMPRQNMGIETTLKTLQVTRVDDFHLVKLGVFAKPKATLLIPDSYLSPSQSPMKEVKGQDEVLLQIPSQSLTLGRNIVTLQWAYTDKNDQKQRFSPIDVMILQDYELGTVQYDAAREAYVFALQLRSGLRLIKSNYKFESANQVNQYHFVASKSDLGSDENAEVSFIVEGEDTEQYEYTVTYSLPKESLPLTILSPVNRYARPDKQLVVKGRTRPHTLVRLQTLTRSENKLEPTPNIEVQANDLGLFSLAIPLKKKVTNRQGDQWEATIATVGINGPAQFQTIQFKQSHTPTWSRYVKRLRKRKEKAKRRYRQFIYSKLVTSPEFYIGKAGRLKGTIAFIDRGQEDQPQRLLVHTCTNNDGCPTWVEDKDAFWVKVGQKVNVFGVGNGLGTHLDHKGKELEVPEIRARLTTP